MVEYCVKVDLTDFTLIVPSVSVGNVGQLTVDLLINSLNLKRLGYVWHGSVIPVAGGDPFGRSTTISTGCELFYSQQLQLAVMQIRSGILRTENDFSQFLCKWARENGISRVIILTGSSAHERTDRQLVGKPLRYIFSPLMSEKEKNSATVREWKELEVKEMSSRVVHPTSEISYIPGSGITMKLYKACLNHKIPCAILIEFCSDGNNAPDAFRLADYLDEWLKLMEACSVDQWVPPPSWILLFGPLPPTEIFN